MMLRCRECNKPKEIAIPGDVTPPKDFLCRDCSAGRSMTDGRNVAEQTNLAKTVYRRGDAPVENRNAEEHFIGSARKY
jgi:hypothetical protein